MKWLFPVVCATMMFTASCTKSDDTPQPANTSKIVNSPSTSTSASTSGGDGGVKKINKPVNNPVPHE